MFFEKWVGHAAGMVINMYTGCGSGRGVQFEVRKDKCEGQK